MLLTKNIQQYICFSESKLVDVLNKINENKARIIFVVSEHGKLLGSISDGDIRRWLTETKKLNLNVLAKTVMNQMSACVKYVSNYDIPVFEIVAARALVSLIISYADVKRKGISIWGNNKPLLLARGAVGTTALMCVYYAVTTLPLAEATILQYVHPIFTALLGVLFLKEHIQKSTMICIAFCLAGLFVMVQPSMDSGSTSELPIFSIAVALCGALGSSIAYVIVRKLSQTEDSSVIIFYFPLVALPISTVLIWNDFVWPSLFLTMILILIGIFTQIGQYGLTKAMQTQAAGKASAYSYVQIVFSALLGVWIFNEIPSIWTYLGGGLIVTGALINVFGKQSVATLKKSS